MTALPAQPLSDVDLASLLVSRVCHDLVSPVGAFSTGLDLLAEEEEAEMRDEALRLLSKSAEAAAAKLQYARLAFGAAGSAGSEIDLTAAGQLMEGALKGSKAQLVWQAEAITAPKDQAKLLLNLAGVAAEALIRGGTLTVSTTTADGTRRLAAVAEGPSARLRSELGAALQGQAPEEGFDGRSAQALFTHRLAAQTGTHITVAAGPDRVELAAVVIL